MARALAVKDAAKPGNTIDVGEFTPDTLKKLWMCIILGIKVKIN